MITKRVASYIRRAATLLGVFAISCVIPSASEASEIPQSALKKGTMEIGLMGGFWQGTTVVGNAQSADRSAFMALPRIGFIVTDSMGTSWWEGNLELFLEPMFAHFTQPFTAQAAGGAFGLKYNFLSFGRWMPFWDAGMGMLWTNLAPRIPEQSTPFEFELETGPGLSYSMTKTTALTTGFRFHHISNGGIGNRNTGMNGFLSYIGISIFLPS